MICGITARHMRRLKERYERYGYDGLVDGRDGRPRRKRISMKTIEKLCELRREKYEDFSVRHFLDDADGRILHAHFVPQQGTLPTLAAPEAVLTRALSAAYPHG